mmetsp:Transcript_136/g.403  ORF Transcript_136/g.403 Transcript_136/m.403 type:complete len:503 (-) Transcript_136:95-1603(-)
MDCAEQDGKQKATLGQAQENFQQSLHYLAQNMAVGSRATGSDLDLWNEVDKQYGIRGLLHARQLMLQQNMMEKSPDMPAYKFLILPGLSGNAEDAAPKKSADHGRKGKAKAHGKQAKSSREGNSTQANAPKGNTKYIPDMGSHQEAPGASKHKWWKVLPVADEVLLRESLDLHSKVVFKVKPGHYVQQAGAVQIFLSGQANGLQRMPVYIGSQKLWATADAQKVGGPKYLERVRSPRWKVVYQADQERSTRGDIVVRRTSSLDSEAIGALFCGTEVDQCGPQEEVQGIIRMPIFFSPDGNNRQQTASAAQAEEIPTGWVTCDASKHGGPLFFKCVDMEPVDDDEPTVIAADDSALNGRPGNTSLQAEIQANGSWSKNRIWRVQNLKDEHPLPILDQPEPFGPPSSMPKQNMPNGVHRFLQNGDIVEQLGHSRKMRGLTVMPVRYLGTGSDVDALLSSTHKEREGWLTRRSADKSKNTMPWVEELVKMDGQWLARKSRGGGDD